MIVDTTVAFLFTHQLSLSIGIMLFVNGYSTVLYYSHERIWSRIGWGISMQNTPDA